MEKAVVNGAGSFVGGDMVRRLREERPWLRRADLKRPEFSGAAARGFLVDGRRDHSIATAPVSGIYEVCQFAEDLGGTGYIFTGEHDPCVMDNSATMNLNILEAGRNSDDYLVSKKLRSVPSLPRRDGLSQTCRRVERQVGAREKLGAVPTLIHD